uniref:Uncharacterized protein n=1 Tax=Oryza sativa subsp. japonica TaxID=39947 RepID=Q69XY5_ORYSJ|nr:hypothetical protein [Oryza sativa Japonica Group]
MPSTPPPLQSATGARRSIRAGDAGARSAVAVAVTFHRSPSSIVVALRRRVAAVAAQRRAAAYHGHRAGSSRPRAPRPSDLPEGFVRAVEDACEVVFPTAIQVKA